MSRIAIVITLFGYNRILKIPGDLGNIPQSM
jgi:hypothetical protein